MKTMTKNDWIRHLWIGLASTSLLLAPVTAQDTDEDDEIIELSPFVVQTDDNIGYLATSTLAGTRIKTELRDVGSAIQVVTPEFLQDTGATSTEDLLVYTTNTEVGGSVGNFAGSAIAADNEGANSQSRANPQNNNRVRGLSSAQATRDYFLTDFGFDAYNSTGITINRGPNSILFGIGEPGGIIENSLKKARLDNNFGQVQFRVGGRSSHRLTFDLNTAIVEDRFAVRFMAMDETTNFKQKPTYEDDTRWTLAGTWKILKNDEISWMGPTVLRANYEKAKIRSTPVNPMPPGDLYSTWWQPPGSPAADAMVGIDRGDYAANYAKQWVTDTPYGSGTTPGNKYQSQPNFWNSYVITYADPSTGAPGVGFPSNDVQVFDGVTGRFQIPQPDGSVATTPGYYPMWSSSNTPWREYPGFKKLTIQDPAVFDWENYFIPGRSQFVNHDFEAYNLTLEQNFFDNSLGFQLAFDHQEKDTHTHFPLGRAGYHSILIDTALYMTNGQLNPNVGRPVIAGMWDPEDYSTGEQDTMRFTAYYNLDFTDNEGWSKWLGNHTVTGLYNEYENDQRNWAMRMSWDDSHDPAQEFQYNQNRVGAWSGGMFFSAYVGDPQFSANSPADLRLYQGYLNLQKPQVGDEYQNYYYHKDRQEISYSTIKVLEFLQWPGGTYQEIDSKGATLQSKFLDNHLVLTYGIREDTARTYQINNSSFRDPDTFAYTADAFTDGWINDGGVGTFEEATPVLDATDETSTPQAVVHVPDSWMDWGGNVVTGLSFHYVDSENFNPANVRRDVNNDVIGNPSGNTEEYGFTLSLFDNRAVARMTWYETTSNNITNPNMQGQMWTVNWPLQMANRWINAKNNSFQEDALQFEDYAWYSPTDGVGPDKNGAEYLPERLGNFTSFDELINAFLASWPDSGSEWNPRIEGPEGNQEVRWDTPIGLSTVASAVSEGFEVEIVYNVTSNWRVAFNASKTESVFGGGLQAVGPFILESEQNLKSLGLWGVANTPSEAGTVEGRYTNETLVSYYSALAKENTVATELRKWHWNLVTNYDFKEGVLDGFGVGGAVRWLDEVSTGYPLVTNDIGILVPDLDNPYTGGTRWNGDVWFSYKTKFRDHNVRFQLNFQNYLGDDEPVPVAHNPDGVLAIVRSAPEKRWFFTTSIDF